MRQTVIVIRSKSASRGDELLTVIPAAILKHYTIESVTCDGNTVAPDADGNWTFTNVGSTLDLTVTF